MAGNDGPQLMAQAKKEEPKKLMIGVPVKVQEPVVFAEIGLNVNIEKGRIKLGVASEDIKKKTPDLSARETEIIEKMEVYFNKAIERYPALAKSLAEVDKTLQVRLINKEEFEDQSTGEDLFGKTAYFSLPSTFSIVIEGKTNDYELARGAVFYLLNKYPEGGLETKASMVDSGSFNIFAARIFGSSFGKPDTIIKGDSAALMAAAFTSAMGADGYINAYLASDTPAAKAKFDSKFGSGAYMKVSQPPLNSWPYDEFVKLISARPDFETIKQELKQSTAKAGFSLSDDLFRK